MMLGARLETIVSEVYDKYNPAVLRMIDLTVKAAEQHGKAVSICGETAGEHIE